jgi:hypothetical protein
VACRRRREEEEEHGQGVLGGENAGSHCVPTCCAFGVE